MDGFCGFWGGAAADVADLAPAAPSPPKKPRGPGAAARRCAAKPKDRKRRKVDAVEAALARFRSEERAAQSRCAEFSARFVAGAAGDDAGDDATDGESPAASPASPASPAAPAGGPARLRLQVGVALAQGARAYMEDRFSLVERLFDQHEDSPASAGAAQAAGASPSLLAVYDGHNGALAAELARARFKELLAASPAVRAASRRARRAPLTAGDAARVRAALVDAFAAVDAEILERTAALGKRDGSTVLLGLLIGAKLFVANLGDSRAVWSTSADARASRVSVDHKPDCAAELERVEEAGGKVIFSGCWRVAHDEIPLRLAISRSLGDHPLKVRLPPSCSAPLVSVEPDVRVVDLARHGDDQFLVFASDGLWDRLSDDDAADLVRDKVAEFQDEEDDMEDGGGRKKEALAFAAAALVEDALEKRSMDNITAMVLSWTTTPEP